MLLKTIFRKQIAIAFIAKIVYEWEKKNYKIGCSYVQKIDDFVRMAVELNKRKIIIIY